jgi:hypothetical protein
VSCFTCAARGLSYQWRIDIILDGRDLEGRKLAAWCHRLAQNHVQQLITSSRAEATGPRIHGICNRRSIMRAHLAITIVAAILVGFVLKLIFFSAPIAVADVGSVKSVSMDISEMHQNIKNIPVEKFYDMTFVFSNGD